MNVDCLRRPWFVHAVSLLMIFAAHFYIFYCFPPVEGWWQTYAYIYNNYPDYYKTINIAFPPLFVFIDAFIMKVSDYYMVYRLFGVFWVMLLYYVFYLSVRRRYGQSVSGVAALIAILVSVYNNAYFPNDYHTVVYLFVALSLLIYQRIYEGRDALLLRLLMSICLAFCVVGALFIKQNIGLILVLATLIGGILSAIKNHNRTDIVVWISCVFFLLVAYGFFVYVFGVTFVDIFKLTLKNDSKGGLITVLLRIIIDENNRSVLLKGLWYFLLFVSYEYVRIKFKALYYEYLGLLDLILFILLGVVFFRDPQGSSVVLCVIYVYYLIYELLGKGRYDVLLIPLLGLVYANTMTAGLSVGGVFLIMPYAIAFFFDRFSSLENNVNNYLRYGFAGVLFFVLVIYKQSEPYNWWGLKQSAIAQAKYELPYEELKGFRVDRATWQIFSDIKRVIDEKSITDNDVYLYPNIPIFYQLHHKIPPTKNLVQWFDVISTVDMKAELISIKNNNPRVVVIMNPPWWVFKGHSNMKDSKLYQQDIIRYFDEQVAHGNYKMVKYQIYDNEMFGDNVNEYDFIDVKIRVNSPAVVGKTIDDLYSEKYLEEQYHIYDILSNSYSVKDIRRHKFRYGDVVIMALRYSQINDLFCKVGVPDINTNDRNVLRIYERSDVR